MNIVIRVKPEALAYAEAKQVEQGSGVFYLTSLRRLYSPRYLRPGDTLYLAPGPAITHACLLLRHQASESWYRKFWRLTSITLEWVGLRRVGPTEASPTSVISWGYITMGPSEKQRSRDRKILDGFRRDISYERRAVNGSP